jgi:hypothetical protein
MRRVKEELSALDRYDRELAEYREKRRAIEEE